MLMCSTMLKCSVQSKINQKVLERYSIFEDVSKSLEFSAVLVPTCFETILVFSVIEKNTNSSKHQNLLLLEVKLMQYFNKQILY